MDKVFFKGKEVSGSQSVVLPGNFIKHPDTCYKSNTAGHKKTRFLESERDTFLIQVLMGQPGVMHR